MKRKSSKKGIVALGYAHRNWSVLPLYNPTCDGDCSCGEGEKCERSGKHPWVIRGVNAASTDIAMIAEFWSQHPNANIGIATGEKSGLIVLDLDEPSSGTETMKIMVAKYGPLPPTVTVRTGNGSHTYWKNPEFLVKRDTQGKVFGPGLDLLGQASYAVAPGSFHKNGKKYLFMSGKSPSKSHPHRQGR